MGGGGRLAAIGADQTVRPGGIGFLQVPLGQTVIAEDQVVFGGHGRAHQPGDTVQERRPRVEGRHHA